MKIGILNIIKSNYFRIHKNLKFFFGFTGCKMEKKSLTDMKKISFIHNRYIRGQNKNSNYFLIYYDKYFKGKKGKRIMECMHITHDFIPVWNNTFFVVLFSKVRICTLKTR
jgi:hypothetical protein